MPVKNFLSYILQHSAHEDINFYPELVMVFTVLLATVHIVHRRTCVCSDAKNTHIYMLLFYRALVFSRYFNPLFCHIITSRSKSIEGKDRNQMAKLQ